MRRFLQIIIWLITDFIFVNMAYYTSYLIRFDGVIAEEPAFIPYTHLWLYISAAHLIVFSIFKLYEPIRKISKSDIFIRTANASIISALASMSITYAMRRFCGFMPSSVFVFACIFNIILAGCWRAFIRYES